MKIHRHLGSPQSVSRRSQSRGAFLSDPPGNFELRSKRVDIETKVCSNEVMPSRPAVHPPGRPGPGQAGRGKRHAWPGSATEGDAMSSNALSTVVPVRPGHSPGAVQSPG